MIKKLKIHYLSFTRLQMPSASGDGGQVIRNFRGFTLIELLVAIAIIGILSSFLLSNFVGVRQRARDGVRKSDLRQIQSALEL
ncbi:MAG: type II secretion system protein, partial [Candidatus Daviesbacteria bacterium]|nr:type II secretion system protein [Candidatus Daviesbacteria bacterium]